MLQQTAHFFSRVFHTLGRTCDRYGPYAYLDARQGELGGVAPFDLSAAVLAYVLAGEQFFFVQIGAHEGTHGDPLTDCVRRHGLAGVMVEPNAAPFAALCRNYADQPQLKFERAAIAPEDGTTTFYSVAPEFWSRHGFQAGIDTQISSLYPEQIRRHVELFGGKALARRESEYLRSETVPALTLTTLLARHGVERLDLLQIDTEGFDFEVLKMVDWARPPAMIHYETVHLSVADRIAAWDLLRSHGYALFATNSYNTLAIREKTQG